MEDQAQARLIIAGVEYHLSKVLAASKTMPRMTLDVKELTPFEKVGIAETRNGGAKFLKFGMIILYQHSGKWIIITGHETVRRAVDMGECSVGIIRMSSQALKRCKVDSFTHGADAGVKPRYGLGDLGDLMKEKHASTVPVKPTNPHPAERPATKPYVPNSGSYDKHQRDIRQMSNDAQRRVDANPSRGARPTMEATPSKPVHVKRDKPVSLADLNVKTRNSNLSGAHSPNNSTPLYNKNTHATLRDASREQLAKQPAVEPGQDRPMEEFGQVQKVVQEVRRTPGRGLYGRNSNRGHNQR